MAALAVGTVLAGTWRLGKFLGEGACAQVYEVTTVGASVVDYDLVAKVIPLPTGAASSKGFKGQQRVCNTLYFEYTIYVNLLPSATLCPRHPLKFYGDDEVAKVRYLIMEKMDMDLVAVAKRGKITHTNVADIGLQILDGLVWMHDKNFLFIDMKPDNFMVKGTKVYFIDFGLVERIGLNKNAKTASFAGTPSYSSVAVQAGAPCSAKDELEALGYVLLSLYLQGNLPWASATSFEQTMQMKVDTDLQALCRSHDCPELAEMIATCREMDCNRRPDYGLVRGYLLKLGARKASPVSLSASAESAIAKHAVKRGHSKASEEDAPVPATVAKRARGKGVSTKVVEVKLDKIDLADADKDSKDNTSLEASPARPTRALSPAKSRGPFSSASPAKEATTDEGPPHRFLTVKAALKSGKSKEPKEPKEPKEISLDKYKDKAVDLGSTEKRRKSREGPFSFDHSSPNHGYRTRSRV